MQRLPQLNFQEIELIIVLFLTHLKKNYLGLNIIKTICYVNLFSLLTKCIIDTPKKRSTISQTDLKHRHLVVRYQTWKKNLD